MVGFALSDSQKNLQRQAAEIAKNILVHAKADYSKYADQESRFRATKPIYEKLIKAGALTAHIPKPLGGTNESFVDSAIQIEELWATDPSVMLLPLGTVLGLFPLILGGTAEQKTKFLESFVSGEGTPLASLVHSEPGGTANWLQKGGPGLSVTARKEGDFYIVNGEKLWASNSGGWDGRGADLACLCCRYTPDGGPQDPNSDPAENVMILLVTRDIVASNDASAYVILEEPELLGHPAVNGPHTRFTNFKVPVDHVLAAPGAGVPIIEQAFATSATLVGAMSVSLMRRAFEEALKFAKRDSRGGTVPIIQHQSVADLLITLKGRIDTSRLLVWKSLDTLQNGPGDYAARLEYCLEAKIFCSDQVVPGITEAMYAVGMSSYRKDTVFPTLLNDAMVLPLFDGGNVGIRRRQIQTLMQEPDYKPWQGTFGLDTVI
ncbi:hypothetical protein DV735_g136, partial [Chaetothyriales sp. CBS 134920]